MKDIFDRVSLRCSRATTRAYSTSFTIGIWCLAKRLRDPIYAIYGFVRLADEIVDSFHHFDQDRLLQELRHETCAAIDRRISVNPILNSFQQTVHEFGIETDLIDLFLKSMEMDLHHKKYDQPGYEQYILGSAEAVGLMCLKVFCHQQPPEYDRLKPYAMKLGSAFQKVNFLRDIQADYELLGRTYFPDVQMSDFSPDTKRKIEQDIAADFAEAFQGLKQLPAGARFGVYVAYVYYLALFKKIRNTPSHRILKTRIRIPQRAKATLLVYSFLKHRLNLL